MELTLSIIAVICLAAAAGLNAWIPVVLAVTLARAALVTLRWPLDGVGAMGLFGVLIPLAMVQMAVSKIPAAARLDGWAQILLRPAAAIVLVMAAGPGGTGLSILLAVVGAFLTLTVLAAEHAIRPMVAATTHGIGVPILSVLEDLLAAVLAVAAILSPMLALAFAGISGYQCCRASRRVKAGWLMRRANADCPVVKVAAVRVERALECGDALEKVAEGESGSVTL